MPKKIPKPPLYPVLPLSGHHIRLLRILPGADDEIIRCTTEVVDLETKPKPIYQALSYVCGSMEDAPTIELNSRTLRIRKNLWDFLHFLRSMKELDYLWCDQICIDEDHLIERNRQVQIMGWIYARSIRALAWVETPQRTDHWVPEGARGIHGEVRKVFLTDVISPSHALDTTEAVIPTPALRCLMEAEYWHRVWIVQELIAAPEAVFLWHSIPIHSKMLTSWVDSKKVEVGDPEKALQPKLLTSTMNEILEYLAGKRPDLSLYNLLKSFSHSSCSDTRDKIFALLSISREYRDGRKLHVQYSKSAGQVFFETLAFIDPEPGETLEAGRLLAQCLELDFDKLWRQTAVTTSSLKSDLKDDIRFRCVLPRLGHRLRLRAETSDFSGKAVDYGVFENVLPDPEILGRCRLFDLGDGVGLVVDFPAGTTPAPNILNGDTWIWPTQSLTWEYESDLPQVGEVPLKKEHLIVAMQLDSDVFKSIEGAS